MSKPGAVPDAWDDDWERVADKPIPEVIPIQPKLSKAERRAQHLQQQRQLWDSAENPDRFHWLESQGVIPLKQEIKPQVTLLSRKPIPTLAKRDNSNGLAQLTLDDDDSDEESRKKRQLQFEERQKQALLEREEKQRRYAEARERIMGPSKPAVAGQSMGSRESSHGRDGRRARARNSGSLSGHATPSTDHSPARIVPNDRAIFDPDDAMTRRAMKRQSAVTPKEVHPIRQPRNPTHTGRGGFGFVMRNDTSGS